MNLIDKEAQILADVKAILGQGGIASKALPSSFVYNEDQVEYALSVVKGFCRYKEETGKTSINALDAATGTGKTLGYLVPLFLCASYSGLRVAVSTFTRQLQRQLLRKEGDVENVTAWVAEVTGKSPLTVSLRMGIKNYISHTACENHRDRLAKDDSGKFLDAIATLEDMMDWLKGTGKYEGKEVSGLMQQYMDDANLESLPFGVKSKNIWLTHKSPIDERANYIKMVFDSKKADVLVINHALLALHAYRWTSILDGEEDRPISLLVCDEADKLPAATEMVVSEDISLHILQKNTKDAGLGGGTVQAVDALYKSVMERVPAFKDLLVIKSGSGFEKEIEDTLDVLKPAAEKAIFLATDEATLEADKTNYYDFADSVNDLTLIYQAIKDKYNSAVISWSPIKEFPSIMVAQPNSGRILSRLWAVPPETTKSKKVKFITIEKDGGLFLKPIAYLRGVLFTSATLALPNQDTVASFDDFFRNVGVIRNFKKIYQCGEDNKPVLDADGNKIVIGTSDETVHHVQLELLHRFEPSQFGQMQIVLADPSINKPTKAEEGEDGTVYSTDPTYLDYNALTVKKAAGEGGRVLVLTLSWRDTNSIAERLKGFPNLIVHTENETLDAVKKAFTDTSNAVLITPAGWEGLDMPGLVKHLVISRIPFSPEDKGRDELLRIYLKSQGFSVERISKALWARRTNEMQRKLTQGIGRGIRRKTDSFKLWLNDPRFPMPDSMNGSLDPVILAGQGHKQYPSLRSSIPARFRKGQYANAQILLTNGTLHSISDMSL